MSSKLLSPIMIGLLCCAMLSGCTWVAPVKGGDASVSATLVTQPTPSDLAGLWLVDSAAGFMPWSLVRSKLTLTDHTFSLTGYYGVLNAWTGSFTLGSDGEAPNLDLKTDPFDMSQYNPTAAMPATTVRGIYKLEPTPDGDRLTICIAKHNKTPRPTEFTDGDDVQLVTFARAHAGFVDFPKNVTVTVLDPDGRPAAGAKIFRNGSHPPAPTIQFTIGRD
jgi:uncharacterized protein (TIGR03067 family)